MTFLKSVDAKLFHSEIPYKPMGKYVHFLTIRVTESYPLFQTDGDLNKARVRAGIDKYIKLLVVYRCLNENSQLQNV
jgi:CRISPR-associated protein Csc2